MLLRVKLYAVTVAAAGCGSARASAKTVNIINSFAFIWMVVSPR